MGASYAAMTCTTLPDCNGVWWPSADSWAALNPWIRLTAAPLPGDGGGVTLHLLHRIPCTRRRPPPWHGLSAVPQKIRNESVITGSIDPAAFGIRPGWYVGPQRTEPVAGGQPRRMCGGAAGSRYHPAATAALQGRDAVASPFALRSVLHGRGSHFLIVDLPCVEPVTGSAYSGQGFLLQLPLASSTHQPEWN